MDLGDIGNTAGQVATQVIDHADDIKNILSQIVASYGIFGIMSILFIVGMVKKFAKFALTLIFIAGIAALFYGGYLTVNFM